MMLSLRVRSRRVKQAIIFRFLSKLTAGLLVFLFLVSPLSAVLAEENLLPVATEPISEEVVLEASEAEASESANTTELPSDENNKPLQIATNEDKKVDNKLNLGVDAVNNFGSLHFNFPINVPVGRNGQKPNIDLIYDSQAGKINDIFGFGWSTSIPYIERVNQTGIENLYSNNDIFNSSFDGEIVKTSSIMTEWYGAKADSGQFLSYQFVNGEYWLVTDKQGIKYIFGYNAFTRQDDPSDATRIYKWMLEEIIDTNGNKINYEYFKDQGQIYPAKITYSNNALTTGIFEINFNRQARLDQVATREIDFLVKTIYRINEIVIKVNGTWTKKYNFSYVTGDNNKKSLLDQIIESGKDEVTGIVSAMPATNFDYQTKDPDWTIDQSWNFPPNYLSNRPHVLADVNGDSLPDIIYYIGMTDQIDVGINTGSGWQSYSNYELPLMTSVFDPTTHWIDVNGDGFVDILDGVANTIYINNKDGSGWTLDANRHIPIRFNFTNEALVDVNGDNLVDIVYYYSNFYPPETQYRVYINNGISWSYDENWAVPSTVFNQGSRFGDVNGDGLVDVIYFSGYWNGNLTQVYINNGSTGWVKEPTWDTPESFQHANNVIVTDINHDGLADIMVSSIYSQPERRAFINNGHGWNYNAQWQLGGEIFSTNSTELSDIDGDGLIDLFDFQYSQVSMANGVKSDLLKSVQTSSGGITTITYKGSAEYKNSGNLLNPNLPINLQTVNSIQVDPINGSAATILFTYSNGFYYHGGVFDHKLAGFGVVTSSDNLGIIKSYYHQGNTSNSAQGEYQDHFSKIGRMYRQEIYDLNNNLFSKVINQWDKAELGNDRNFVKLVRTTKAIYDGNTSHKDSAETYSYDDTTGNKISLTQWGEVNASNNGDFTDISNDKLITNVTYAVSANNITGLAATEATYDQTGAKVSASQYYYDNLPLGSVSLGNQTKQAQWVSGKKYVSWQKVYNALGLVTKEIDPLGRETNYTYEANNLYPASISNPAGQVSSFSYDYSSGQVKSSTDPNNQIFKTHYDGLDRVIKEEQPDATAPGLLVTKATYEYTDLPNANKIKQRIYLDADNIVDDYTYFDGLGRKIQTRREAENNNQFSVRDFIYSANNLLEKESLPYFSNGSALTAATEISELYTIYSYDALKRVVSAQNVIGATSNSYDDYRTTVVDAKGKIKDLYKDVYDNLVQVNEHNGSEIYSTYYQWNSLKKLTKITDALGNVRNFSYDGLGRAIMAEDLHAVNDSTFGVWYYDYDDAGNLISKTAPNTKVTAYTYDNLNRVLSEDVVGNEVVDVSYEYDHCQNGIGRLCLVINPTVKVSSFYNPLGQITKEEKRIGRSIFTTNYEYDRQGNQTLIINPDDSLVVYVYNNAGLAESVQRKETSDPELTDVISNIDYNPVGLVTLMIYGNGSITSNTYDENELYRLRHKVTVSDNQNVQDLIYTYDPVGNILKIVDASATQTAKTTDYTYDDLHRLLSATISNSVAKGIDGPDNQNQVQTFTYDAIGNILFKSDVGAYSYTGNVGDSYANPQAVTTAGDKEYVYDENGNITQINSASLNETKTLNWDYNNRLSSIMVGDKLFNYSYDASGQRIKEVSSSGTTLYPTKNYSLSPESVDKHIFLGDTAIATVVNKKDEVKTYNIHADHLTGSNVITDAEQKVNELTDYYSFGTIRLDEQSGNYNEKRKFTGHEYDAETGLNYMGQRYYEPTLGRFLSQDPVFLSAMDAESVQEATQMTQDNYLGSPQTMNAYTYVANNPLKYKDYKGEFLDTVVDIGFIAYDLYKIGQALNNGQSIKSELGNLGLDLAGAALPGVTGLGMIARTAKAADKVADTVRATKEADRIMDASKLLPTPKESLGRFPANPNELLPSLPRDAKGSIRVNDTTRIRVEKHGSTPGKPNGARHVDQHYHVDVLKPGKTSFNKNSNYRTLLPEGYVAGRGKGFLPGDKFPGVYNKLKSPY